MDRVSDDPHGVADEPPKLVSCWEAERWALLLDMLAVDGMRGRLGGVGRELTRQSLRELDRLVPSIGLHVVAIESDLEDLDHHPRRVNRVGPDRYADSIARHVSAIGLAAPSLSIQQGNRSSSDGVKEIAVIEWPGRRRWVAVGVASSTGYRPSPSGGLESAFRPELLLFVSAKAWHQVSSPPHDWRHPSRLVDLFRTTVIVSKS